LQWAHIYLNGSYHFTDITLEGDFRPLREYQGSREHLSLVSENAARELASLEIEEEMNPVQLSLLEEEEQDW